jgi:hypothetical protein
MEKWINEKCKTELVDSNPKMVPRWFQDGPRASSQPVKKPASKPEFWLSTPSKPWTQDSKKKPRWSQDDPRWSQDDPKMVPRWYQYGPKMVPGLFQDAPKMAPRRSQDDPKMGPRWSQDDSRWSQDGPKMVPRWSKMVPRWVQDGPKMTPRWSQDGSKMVPRWSQDDAKMVPRCWEPRVPFFIFQFFIFHFWTRFSSFNFWFFSFSIFHFWIVIDICKDFSKMKNEKWKVSIIERFKNQSLNLSKTSFWKSIIHFETSIFHFWKIVNHWFFHFFIFDFSFLIPDQDQIGTRSGAVLRVIGVLGE